MHNVTTRRQLLGGIAAVFAAGPALAGAPGTSLRPKARSLNSRARLPDRPEAALPGAGFSGDVGWAVADVKTGLRLESVQGNAGLPPASVTKAVTALYALETLGGGYRFQTRLIANGKVEGGILKGNLILAGGGDPTLNTDRLAAMAGQLKAAGVREVRGDFLIYDGALPYSHAIDGEQPGHVGYNPAVSGIALNYNRVYFEWKRAGSGYSVAMDARTKRYRPEVHMASMRVVNRKMPVYTYKDAQSTDQWTVASGALGAKGGRWLPVRRPAEYAGDVFRTMARSHGIQLKPARVTRTLGRGAVIVTDHSPDLHVILKGMLKYSNNLTAEMVGMTASAKRVGRPPASLRSSAQQMSRWAVQRYDMKNTQLVDHSGLGDASRMTADDLVGALVEARRRGTLRTLLKPIPVRDEQGRIVKKHPVKVHAKTGTLNFVSGLGGFMTAADGTELAFAVFAADTATRNRIRKADRERPPGARGWNGRAKQFQQKLIKRWDSLYGS